MAYMKENTVYCLIAIYRYLKSLGTLSQRTGVFLSVNSVNTSQRNVIKVKTYTPRLKIEK